ncbi:MAG TPA: DUF3606 domain-containing protein [Rhizobacter sp.]
MQDKPKPAAKADSEPRINLKYETDVRHWSKRFRIGAEELRAVVRLVGDRPSAVQRYLARDPESHV